MRWNIWIFAIMISIGLGGASMTEGYQKISRCKVHDKVMTPNYKVGIIYDAPPASAGGPPMTAVHISIDAKSFNRDELLRLALKLKKEFCREAELLVVVYDDPAYINQIYYSAHPWFHRAEESKRGYYYLDRKTGEEYVGYCTVRNILRNPDKRVRIELGRSSTRKPETQ